MFSNFWKVENRWELVFERKGIALLDDVLVIRVQLDFLHELVEETLLIELALHLNIIIIEFLILMPFPLPILALLSTLILFLLSLIPVSFVYKWEDRIILGEPSRHGLTNQILQLQEYDGKRNHRVPFLLQHIALHFVAEFIYETQRLFCRSV